MDKKTCYHWSSFYKSYCLNETFLDHSLLADSYSRIKKYRSRQNILEKNQQYLKLRTTIKISNSGEQVKSCDE